MGNSQKDKSFHARKFSSIYQTLYFVDNLLYIKRIIALYYHIKKEIMMFQIMKPKMKYIFMTQIWIGE